MKVDQLNNFTTEKINEVLASRFGQTIDLSEESIDNLKAVVNEINDFFVKVGPDTEKIFQSCLINSQKIFLKIEIYYGKKYCKIS